MSLYIGEAFAQLSMPSITYVLYIEKPLKQTSNCP